MLLLHIESLHKVLDFQDIWHRLEPFHYKIKKAVGGFRCQFSSLLGSLVQYVMENADVSYMCSSDLEVSQKATGIASILC